MGKNLIIFILIVFCVNNSFSQRKYSDTIINRFENGDIKEIILQDSIVYDSFLKKYKPVFSKHIVFFEKDKIEYIVYIRENPNFYDTTAYKSIEDAEKNRKVDTTYCKKVYSYYKNGNLKRVFTWKPYGKMDSIEISYYESGQKRGQTFWKNGLAEGLSYGWNSDGSLSGVQSYKNGKLDGLSIDFYLHGDISIKSWKSDFPNGEFLLYDRKGKLLSSATYKNGLMHGKIKDDLRGLPVEGTFSNGNGVDTVFFFNKRINQIRKYTSKVIDTTTIFSREYQREVSSSNEPDSIFTYDKKGQLRALYSKSCDSSFFEVKKDGVFLYFENKKIEIFNKQKQRVEIITIVNNILTTKEKLVKGQWQTEYYDKDSFMYRKTTSKGDEYFENKKKKKESRELKAKK